MASKIKHLLLPLAKPFLPLIYQRRYRRLTRQIDELFSNAPTLFFFFPAYHMGGAEKIHLQILETVADKDKAVFICYKSSSDVLKNDFISKASHFIDFHVLGNYPYFQKRLNKLLADRLNQMKHPATILGCNVFLFYDIVDQVTNPLIRKVDLLHAFSPYINGIEERAVHTVDALDRRIVINLQTRQDLKHQYQQRGIPEEMISRVSVIYNPLLTACKPARRTMYPPFKCLWVARGSKEKRPWVYIALARESRKAGLPFEFSLVGDVGNLVPEDAATYVKLYGSVHNWAQLEAIYKSHDLMITTSVYEGFPLTITESICNGLINISTDVGGIPEHILHATTGYLVANSKDEEVLIRGFIAVLRRISDDPQQLDPIRVNALQHISSVFSKEKFESAYRDILLHE